MQVYCGIDWVEGHRDVALVDQHGAVVAKRRISDDAAGFGQLMALLAEHGDVADTLVPVAIETSRGLLVAGLRGTGRIVYVINPLAVSRYRDRYSVARKKSDQGDAVVLASILRTDAHAHRPLPADSELVQAIAVLARAQQDAVWNRQPLVNQPRSLLREYYPNLLYRLRHPRGRSAASGCPCRAGRRFRFCRRAAVVGCRKSWVGHRRGSPRPRTRGTQQTATGIG
jgi:transposase